MLQKSGVTVVAVTNVASEYSPPDVHNSTLTHGDKQGL
jgi:hypothetical protein